MEIYISLIGLVGSVISAVVGYKQGEKKSNAEANSVIFESYRIAIETLRGEFTRQIEDLQTKVVRLQTENDNLKNKVDKLESERKGKL